MRIDRVSNSNTGDFLVLRVLHDYILREQYIFLFAAQYKIKIYDDPEKLRFEMTCITNSSK